MHPGNVADEHFADSFIEKVVQYFGRVDYAVNCAGVLGLPQRSAETSLAEFDRVNNINYRGCWLSSRAQLRQMVRQDGLPSYDPSRPPQRGAIVNIASQLGLVGRPSARKYYSRFTVSTPINLHIPIQRHIVLQSLQSLA